MHNWWKLNWPNYFISSPIVTPTWSPFTANKDTVHISSTHCAEDNSSGAVMGGESIQRKKNTIIYGHFKQFQWSLLCWTPTDVQVRPPNLENHREGTTEIHKGQTVFLMNTVLFLLVQLLQAECITINHLLRVLDITVSVTRHINELQAYSLGSCWCMLMPFI